MSGTALRIINNVQPYRKPEEKVLKICPVLQLMDAGLQAYNLLAA